MSNNRENRRRDGFDWVPNDVASKWVGGINRPLGLPKREGEPGEIIPLCEARPGGPSEWEDKGRLNQLPSLVWHWINQRSQNSCCPCSFAQATMLRREYYGLDQKVMSQATLFGQNDRNGTPRRTNTGMSIQTGAWLTEHQGFCSTDVIDQYDYLGHRDGDWPDDWEAKATLYRIRGWRDVAAAETAIDLATGGLPVPFGYFTGRGGRGGGGHAVVLINYEDGMCKALGSWSKDYGAVGVHTLRLDTVRRGIEYFGAAAPVVPVDPIGDGDIV